MMQVKADFRNSFGRGGVKDYGIDFEAAVRAATVYLSCNNSLGRSANVRVNVYDGQPSTLKFAIDIQSIFSGKRYNSGYAIPVNEDKFRLVLALYNDNYGELLEKAIWMMPNGSHFFDFRNAKYEKEEERILLDCRIYSLIKMHHQKFYEKRLHEIYIADIEGEDGSIKAECMHYENGRPAEIVKDIDNVMELKGNFTATISKFELEDKPIYLVMTTACKDDKAFRNYVMALLQKQYGIKYADIIFEEEAK